jgi:hypothetical protein
MNREERRQLWQARMTDYRQSGLSLKAWCALQEYTPDQLKYWLYKRTPKIPDTTSRLTSPQFISLLRFWIPLQAPPCRYTSAPPESKSTPASTPTCCAIWFEPWSPHAKPPSGPSGLSRLRGHRFAQIHRRPGRCRAGAISTESVLHGAVCLL